MENNQPSALLKYSVLFIVGTTVVMFLYMISVIYGINIPSLEQNGSVNFLAIFLTGLITGGLTCLAVQGGLLATSLAQIEQNKIEEESKSTGKVVPIISFLVAKLAAYTLLGFLLGLLGSVVQLSLTGKIIMQLVAAFIMFGAAMNLLNVHPIFRYFVLQPPKFLSRMVRKKSKSDSIFAPAVLGAFTVFIPCGTTQAMMALAIASGSAILGMTIMFTFVLGTSPLFFALGYFATRLGEAMHKRFVKLAALVLIFLSVYSVWNTFALTGFNFSTKSVQPDSNAHAVTNATITINQRGYEPAQLNVKKGEEITLKIANTDGWGCQQAFVIPQIKFEKVIAPGQETTVKFTAPNKEGQIAFMCSMGMYRGVINVI